MYFKKWEELPETMRRDAVRPYYEALEKRKAGIIVKRWIDLILALGLSLVLSPVMLILALCIKLDSRGPVFFRQERVTRYGKLYRIFKFRTMVNDADKKGPAITKSGDARITRMGQKTGPLLSNLIQSARISITGDMSFVGTRPEVKKYVDEYTEEMYATLLLPAGITSRTSIAYKDEDEVMESYLTKTGKSVDEVYVEYVLPEKMRWNLRYLKEFSVFGDFKIMIDTVLAVLK